MLDLFISTPFLFMAILTGLALSLLSGMIGSYVVTKRIVFISGAISHAVLGGMGICLWLERTQGIEYAHPLIGAFCFAIISALLIGFFRLHYREREDTAISATWSIGMALGLLFISKTPGYNVELSSFLMGNILFVTPEELVWLLIVDAFLLLLVVILHHRLTLICFDETQAILQGVPFKFLYYALLVVVALVTVLLIQMVGIILVLTLLTIPTAIASRWTKSFAAMIGLSILFSGLFSTTGILIAYEWDWPTGAAIALIAAVVYFFLFFIEGLSSIWRRHKFHLLPSPSKSE